MLTYYFALKQHYNVLYYYIGAHLNNVRYWFGWGQNMICSSEMLQSRSIKLQKAGNQNILDIPRIAPLSVVMECQVTSELKGP